MTAGDCVKKVPNIVIRRGLIGMNVRPSTARSSMDRAWRFGRRGCGFESCRAGQTVERKDGMMFFESLVRSSEGPTFVRVKVENGVTMLSSTGCPERIFVMEGEQITIETATFATTDIPIRISAERVTP
jgi:hypothetical protein